MTWPQVIRWRIQQQFLARRAPREAMLDVARRLVGIQAQLMSAAELAFCPRVEGITRADVRAALWQQRALVKTWGMRGTLHLVAASDFWLYAAAHSARKRHLLPAWLKYTGLTAAESERLNGAIREALDGRCLTRAELAREVQRATGMKGIEGALLTGWGGLLKPAADYGFLCFGPNQGQNVTFVRPDQWLGSFEVIDPDAALREVLRRYLAVFGPSDVHEFARWWGTEAKNARSAFAAIQGELADVEIEGRRAVALGSTIDSLTATGLRQAAVRLLPNFDTYVLAAGRALTKLLPSPALKPLVSRTAGWISAVVEVDGRLEGVWTMSRRGAAHVVELSPFADLSAATQRGIEEEAGHLARFLGTQVSVVVRARPGA